MTKKVYTKPELKSEAFVPQTHVAACGDSGTVYKFTCDAPRGTLYYFRDKPASGSQPTIGNRGIWLGNYHPCSAFHEAEAQSGFYWGYVDYNHNQIVVKDAIKYNRLNEWGKGRELPKFAGESFNSMWKKGKVQRKEDKK